MKSIVCAVALAGIVTNASASECLKEKAEACSYYEYMAGKSMKDFKAAVGICVESSRDTTDKFGLDVGAEYYKSCRATLQGMVSYTNDRLLEYNGCVAKFRC